MLSQYRTRIRSAFGPAGSLSTYFPVIVTAVLYAIVAAVSYAVVGNKAPMPFSSLDSAIDWASWFDVLIAFPALSILCAIPFVGKRSSYVIVPVILLSPLFLIMDSFFLVYNLPSLGLLLFILPIINLAPAALIAIVYIVPLVLCIFLVYEAPRGSLQIRAMPKFYFVAAAAVSLTLVAIDFFMRYSVLGNSSSLISVVSDVGWAAQVGAKDLIHGISPYSAPLPPWGGSAPLSYGPMEFVLLAPFAPLSINLGAHVASVFYLFLTILGIFMTVRIFRPSAAPVAALMFVALPVTFYIVSAAFTQHIIAASLIVWATFFYFTSKYRLSGLLLALSGLTIGIPFALILPFVVPLKGYDKVKLLQGYVPIVAILPVGLILIFGQTALTSLNAFTGVVTLYGLGLFLTPLARSILMWIPVAAIFGWFLYESLTGKTKEDALRTSALFMMLLPFAVGYFYAFFFIWQGVLLIIYLFVRMEVNTKWNLSSEVA